MQSHWMTWGPPVYIPVAGYFKLGKLGKKKASSNSSSPVKRRPGLPDKPTGHDDIDSNTPGARATKPFGEGKGNLNDLLAAFRGGVIK